MAHLLLNIGVNRRTQSDTVTTQVATITVTLGLHTLQLMDPDLMDLLTLQSMDPGLMALLTLQLMDRLITEPHSFLPINQPLLVV